MRTCANGHHVRDGMFVCGRCGTDRITDRITGQITGRITEPDGPSTPTRIGPLEAERVAARAELTTRMGTGASLLVLAVACAALSTVAASSASGAAAFLLSLAANVLALAGAGFMLVAVVGHGVRLTLGSSRIDPRED